MRSLVNGVNKQNMRWLHFLVHFKWNCLKQHKYFLMSQYFCCCCCCCVCLLFVFDTMMLPRRSHAWFWWGNATPYWHTLNVSLRYIIFAVTKKAVGKSLQHFICSLNVARQKHKAHFHLSLPFGFSDVFVYLRVAYPIENYVQNSPYYLDEMEIANHSKNLLQIHYK